MPRKQECQSCRREIRLTAKSAPNGSVCQECRARLVNRFCIECGHGFRAHHSSQVFCTIDCAVSNRWGVNRA